MKPNFTIAHFPPIAAMGLLTLASTIFAQDSAPKAPDIYAMQPQARFQYVHADIDNTVAALLDVERHLRKLPKKELVRLRTAARDLLGRCPYTHATFALVTAARDAVRALPAYDPRSTRTDPREKSLATVRRSFEVHGRILDLLHIPSELAAIDSKVGTDKLVASATTRMKGKKLSMPSHAGLARAYALLSTVRERVDALPKKSQEELQAAQATFAAPTAGLWNFKGIMIRCATELESARRTNTATDKKHWIEPKGKTPRRDAIAEEILLVLRSHFVLYC